MLGRRISEYDNDILNELKTKYSNYVKIDFDILNEPCIFLKYRGPWEMIYKLSSNGQYVRPRIFYCMQIDDAITDFVKSRDEVITRKKYNEFNSDKMNKSFEKQREQLKSTGFKDII